MMYYGSFDEKNLMKNGNASESNILCFDLQISIKF